MAAQITRDDFLSALQEFSASKPAFRVLTLTFGSHPSRRVGEGIEFREYRPHEPGEDVSSIDVEATLRTGEKLVRLDLAEEKIRYLLTLDDSRSLDHYGMRQTALLVLGCYALSAIRARDPVKILLVSGGGSVKLSPPIFSSDDLFAFLLEAWEKRLEISSSSTSCSKLAALIRQTADLDNSRVLLVSDLAFYDTGGISRSKNSNNVFRHKEVLKRALGSIVASDDTELLVIGIAPQWEEFRGLRGFFRMRDSEDGSLLLTHFTKKSVREFLEWQEAREKLWQETLRSFNVPLLWLHAGLPREVVKELARGVSKF